MAMSLFKIGGWIMFALVLVLVIILKVFLKNRREKLDGIQGDAGKSAWIKLNDEFDDDWTEI